MQHLLNQLKRDAYILAVAMSLVWSSCLTGCDDNKDDDDAPPAVVAQSPLPSESGTVQLHPNGNTAYVINTELTENSSANTADEVQTQQTNNRNFNVGSLTAIRVENNGQDDATFVGELKVGRDPRSISISNDGKRAYVSNGADNNVTVIDLGKDGFGPYAKLATIKVGSEPRGTALNQNGKKLYVANYADGTLSVIDTDALAVSKTISLSNIAHPYAVSASVDGEERVYVSDFLGRPRDGKGTDQIEGFDDGKEGRLAVIRVSDDTQIATIKLNPIDSGFTADRTKFDTDGGAANNTYKAPTGTDKTKVMQKVFFNQLFRIAINPDQKKLYVTSIGAQPEPPSAFNTNVQALIGAVDRDSQAELSSEHVNLNNDIKKEDKPATAKGSFQRAFAADTVAMSIRNGVIVFVSRGGSYAMKGKLGSDGKITVLESDGKTVRKFAVGSIPTGVILNRKGTRAYIYSEVNAQLTILDLPNNQILNTVNTTDLEPSGSEKHNILLGKLAFFGGMGVPLNNLTGMDVRSIKTADFRNIASDNSWSSCGSCHPDGLSDGVTWLFPTGPRQTIPLDATFSPRNSALPKATDANGNDQGGNQRVLNWNAVRGSVTDFNNNALNVQGGAVKGQTDLPEGEGTGFADDSTLIFNHGDNDKNGDANTKGSDALDIMTLWVRKGIRVFNRPSNLDSNKVAEGRRLFESHCKNCHGGEKWTSSRVRWTYPLFTRNPETNNTDAPNNARVDNLREANVATVVEAFDKDNNGSFEVRIVRRVDDGGDGVDTLDLTHPIEVRGAGPNRGKASAGAAASFNPPSLFNVSNTAPYGHHGRAQTIKDVFEAFTPRASGGLGHKVRTNPTNSELETIIEFLKAIDGDQEPFSE